MNLDIVNSQYKDFLKAELETDENVTQFLKENNVNITTKVITIVQQFYNYDEAEIIFDGCQNKLKIKNSLMHLCFMHGCMKKLIRDKPSNKVIIDHFLQGNGKEILDRCLRSNCKIFLDAVIEFIIFIQFETEKCPVSLYKIIRKYNLFSKRLVVTFINTDINRRALLMSVHRTPGNKMANETCGVAHPICLCKSFVKLIVDDIVNDKNPTLCDLMFLLHDKMLIQKIERNRRILPYSAITMLNNLYSNLIKRISLGLPMKYTNIKNSHFCSKPNSIELESISIPIKPDDRKSNINIDLEKPVPIELNKNPKALLNNELKNQRTEMCEANSQILLKDDISEKSLKCPPRVTFNESNNIEIVIKPEYSRLDGKTPKEFDKDIHPIKQKIKENTISDINKEQASSLLFIQQIKQLNLEVQTYKDRISMLEKELKASIIKTDSDIRKNISKSNEITDITKGRVISSVINNIKSDQTTNSSVNDIKKDQPIINTIENINTDQSTVKPPPKKFSGLFSKLKAKPSESTQTPELKTDTTSKPAQNEVQPTPKFGAKSKGIVSSIKTSKTFAGVKWKKSTKANCQIFSKIDYEIYEKTFDVAEFDIFEVKEEKKEKIEIKEAQKPTEYLMDPKKSYALNIALGRVKLSNKDFLEKIFSGEFDDENITKQLILYFPSEEEHQRICSASGELGKAELLFKEINDLSDFYASLKFLRFNFAFKNRNYSKIIKSMACTFNRILESNELLNLFGTLLVIGNVLNSRSFNGNAEGFSFDSLQSFNLKEIKGLLKKKVNIPRLIFELTGNDPSSEIVLMDFEIPIETLIYEINEMKTFYGDFVNEEIAKEYAELSNDFENMLEAYKKAQSYFGENGEKFLGKLEEFLKKIY